MDIRATTPIAGVIQATPAPRPIVARVPEVRPVQASPDASTPKGGDDTQYLQKTMAAVAEHLGDYLRSSDRELEFRVDSGTRATVITVRDGTGDVVRQIPNETALRLMRLLNAESGTLIDRTA